MIRRVLFSVIAVFGGDISFMQLQVFMFCSVLNLLYLGYYKPLEGKIQNFLEIFNEITILGVAYHLCLFTDFVEDFHK